MVDFDMDKLFINAGILDKNKNLIKKDLPKLHDDEIRKKLGIVYEYIISILKKYCDLREEYYPILTLWIIGTYMHKNFISYPYLFINATKGSGKSRLMKLTTILSNEGVVLNSLTEAVLFRSTGTLGIDEFEGIARKGMESLRELLNSAYKKGVKVKRLKKVNMKGEEKQVIEEFDVYRPIILANIFGMEEVLGSRCLEINIEKSEKGSITKLIEDFDNDTTIQTTLTTLNYIKCSLCSVVTVFKCIRNWNNYIISKYNTTHTTHNTHTTHTTHTTQQHQKLTDEELSFFNKVDSYDINGRDLELTLPLLVLANYLDPNLFEEVIKIIVVLIKEKKEEDYIESRDVSLIDFVSQRTPEEFFISINRLTNEFKQFLQSNEDWINSKWLGRALKRLNLIKEKRRLGRGVELILNISKAQEKIRMFK